MTIVKIWLGLSFDGIEIGDGTALLRTSDYVSVEILSWFGSFKKHIWYLKGTYNPPFSYIL